MGKNGNETIMTFVSRLPGNICSINPITCAKFKISASPICQLQRHASHSILINCSSPFHRSNETNTFALAAEGV